MQNQKTGDGFLLATLGLFCLAIGLGAYFAQAGTKVKAPKAKPQVLQAESKGEMNAIVYGPYKLTQDGRVHQIDVRIAGALPENNSSRWCEFTLLNSKKEPIGQFSYDFWAEKGQDEDGSWSEVDIDVSQTVVLEDAGDYYLAATSDKPVGQGADKKAKDAKRFNQPPPSFHLKPDSFKITIWEGCYDPTTLWMVAGASFVALGLALLGRLGSS